MRSRMMWTLAAVVAAAVVGATSSPAAEVRVIGTQNAIFSLNGTRLGAYADHTPLVVTNVPVGSHKLYVRSLITQETQLYTFTIDTPDQKLKEWKANFAPPKQQSTKEGSGGGVNQQARNRLIIGGLGLGNEVLTDKSDAQQNRRAVVVAAAVANEVFAGKKHDRKTSAEQGNTIEIKTTVPLDVNVDGQGAKAFEARDKIVFTKLAPGAHKVFLRNRLTGELRTFGSVNEADPSKPGLLFPPDGTCTITINPEFAPPKGETVNAQARRRTGVLGALALNEILGRNKEGESKEKLQDRRKVLVGATILNEVIPTSAGKHRKAVNLDFANLPPDLPTTVAGTVERPREATVKGSAAPNPRSTEMPADAPAAVGSPALPTGAQSLTGGSQPTGVQGLVQQGVQKTTTRRGGFLGKLFGGGSKPAATEPPPPAPEQQ